MSNLKKFRFGPGGEGVKSEKKLGYPPAKWERKSFETRENV